jgi:hypothetical protein
MLQQGKNEALTHVAEKLLKKANFANLANS